MDLLLLLFFWGAQALSQRLLQRAQEQRLGNSRLGMDDGAGPQGEHRRTGGEAARGSQIAGRLLQGEDQLLWGDIRADSNNRSIRPLVIDGGVGGSTGNAGAKDRPQAEGKTSRC